MSDDPQRQPLASEIDRLHQLDDAALRNAEAQGRERQRIADHTQEQDDHLDRINGSIEKSAVAIESLTAHLEAVEEARHAEMLVAAALADAFKKQAEGGLTKARLYISVIVIFVPLIGVLITTLTR